MVEKVKTLDLIDKRYIIKLERRITEFFKILWVL